MIQLFLTKKKMQKKYAIIHRERDTEQTEGENITVYDANPPFSGFMGNMILECK